MIRRLLALLLSLCLVSPAWGAVAFDAASNGSYDGGDPPHEFSWSHTCTGCNYLAVCVAHTTGPTVSGITYGAQSLTLRQTFFGDTNGAEYWDLLAPATGANTITVIMAESNLAAAGAVTFSGVDQTTPRGTIVTADVVDGDITVNVTVAAGGIATDCLYTSNAPAPVVGAGQTERFNQTSPTPFVTAAGSTEGGTGVVAMSWSSLDAEVGKIIAVPLNGATAPTGSSVARRRH